MKRLLLASAAVITLAIAAPIAGAQYTQPVPAPPPYESTQSTPSDPMLDDPIAPMSTPSTTRTTTTTTTQNYPNTSTSTPYANTYAAQPQTNAGVNTTTQQGVTQNYGETTTTTQAQTTYGATTTQAQSDYGATTTQAQSNYGADAQYAMGENTLTDADLQQVALDAGMPGVPMSAAEVCAPRDVSLAQNTSRLNRDARRQLINATDHASVCDIQQVTIKAPDGRGEAVRQTLVAQGVDDAMISVEDSDGELGVEMAFSGVATSSEYYAQMFNQPQFAANTAAPAGASQYDPATGQYAPSTATPETADPYASPSSTSSDYRETAADAYEAQPSAQPISYQPEPVGAPIE